MKLQPVEHDPHEVGRILMIPEIVAALQKPVKVVNKFCVPYGAGRSVDDNETYVDQHIPRYDQRFKVRGGQLGDIWAYTDIHEKTEFAAMTLLGMDYVTAHHRVATPLERYFVERDGGNWKTYSAIWAAKLRETQHQHIANAPPRLYLAPYPFEMRSRLERAGTRLVPIDNVKPPKEY
jgi:hypothetical protein